MITDSWGVVVWAQSRKERPAHRLSSFLNGPPSYLNVEGINKHALLNAARYSRIMSDQLLQFP